MYGKGVSKTIKLKPCPSNRCLICTFFTGLPFVLTGRGVCGSEIRIKVFITTSTRGLDSTRQTTPQTGPESLEILYL